ncbi:hypothetical protein [Bradyrhizobium sp. LHD-71]|uniref:hypothetical protein n=1 Tax=Bradyrhizobium sp. LHD-71 TaxID=3072141 RepID=UPI00280D2939|nr:hypothetical protein [Bradyrhizobium sp. LHD-71]MDQ8726237.1 hypothetical protein [Bradyrhizobium sp. LHD-71]
MSWQLAVLKILAVSEDGQASVASVTRSLSILVTGADEWEARLRRSIPTHHPCDIFSGGLVDRPARGVWRILPAGRDYLRSLEPSFEFKKAAE